MIAYYSDDAVTIYHGDCEDIVPDLPLVDLVFTSPPYNLGASPTGGPVVVEDRTDGRSVAPKACARECKRTRCGHRSC